MKLALMDKLERVEDWFARANILTPAVDDGPVPRVIHGELWDELRVLMDSSLSANKDPEEPQVVTTGDTLGMRIAREINARQLKCHELDRIEAAVNAILEEK